MNSRLYLLIIAFYLGLAVLISDVASAQPAVKVDLKVQFSHYWSQAEQTQAESLRVSKSGDILGSSTATASGVWGEDAGSSTTYPNSAQGVLFGQISNSNSTYYFRCSATSVPSPTNNLVLSAGHCLDVPGQGTAENLVFIPGYRNGQTPYGQWKVTSFSTTPQWASSFNSSFPDFGNDLAFLQVANQAQPLSTSRALAPTVGTIPLAFNTNREVSYQEYGYPSAAPYDGNLLYRLDTAYAHQDDSFVPATTAIASDFTGGSSGGAWLSNGSVVGINSYTYPTIPEWSQQMFSPYFGNNAQNLYASNGGDVPVVAPDAVVAAKPTSALPPGKIRIIAKVSRANGSGRLQLEVPGAGNIKVSGAVVTQTVSTIGANPGLVIPIALKPHSRALKLLRKHHHRSVPLSITYGTQQINTWFKLIIKKK